MTLGWRIFNMVRGHIMSTSGLVAIETPPVENVMAISKIAKRKCIFACMWHRNQIEYLVDNEYPYALWGTPLRRDMLL
jgi:hypothetical protein